MHRVLARQLTLYAIVGVIGTLMDIGIFWALIGAHLWPWLAATCSYCSATSTQFVLNRQYSFQAFDRHALHQLRTYAVVAVICWCCNLGVLELGIHAFGLAPLPAKILAIAPTAVVGFCGNRFCTFGPGIRATLRRALGRSQ